MSNKNSRRERKMKTINDYRVVSDYNIEDFQRKVNKAILAGFQPLGGVAISINTDYDTQYIQAMVTYDDDYPNDVLW